MKTFFSTIILLSISNFESKSQSNYSVPKGDNIYKNYELVSFARQHLFSYKLTDLIVKTEKEWRKKHSEKPSQHTKIKAYKE